MYLKNKDALIHVRVSSSMHDHLIEISKKYGMTLSAYLRFVIGSHLSSVIANGSMDMHENK